MYKYFIEVPLEYNKESKLNNYGFCNRQILELKEPICLKYDCCIQKENFKGNEPLNITIFSKQNTLIIKFEYIYADSKEYSLELIKPTLNNICYCISFITQYSNTNTHYFDAKFTYNINNINVKEEEYSAYEAYIENGKNTLKLFDSINIEEKLNNTITRKINLENIGKMVDGITKNSKLNYVMECYYKALGNIEYTSKYYNLFIVIEFLETNYSEKINPQYIFSKKEKEDFSINVKEFLENNLKKDTEIMKRISSRINQIILNATLENRQKKLYRIITEYLGIDSFSNSGKIVKITEQFVKTLIKLRNELFHSKKISEDEENSFKDITNQLIILCGEIINKLFEKL